MKELLYSQAMTEALREEMTRDPNVMVIGPDVRLAVSGFYTGLYQEFGPKRLINMPLSENCTVGIAVGAAMVGMRPVVDCGGPFMWIAFDQLINQAAKDHYLFGAQAKVPVVYRFYMNPRVALAAHHTDRLYSALLNVPGLKIICPTTPYNVKGLWKTAIRDDNPVCVFDSITDYTARDKIPDEEYLIPFGKADVVRPGKDVTLVTIFTRRDCIEAADTLQKEGISVEIIDPQTLIPLDLDAILKSVAKTGRLVIADIANDTGSAASHIAALVADKGFDLLKASIKRVCVPDVHIPHSPDLERIMYPTGKRIAKNIRDITSRK